MQVDPIGMEAVDVENPQTLNLYGYTANDPINSVDPLGLDMTCAGGVCTVTPGNQPWLTLDQMALKSFMDRLLNPMYRQNPNSRPQDPPKIDPPPRPIVEVKKPTDKLPSLPPGETCGVNPVTGQPGFTPNPRGVPGNVRPGVGGEGHFGARRAGGRRQHKGLDVSGGVGDPIYANRSGRVTAESNNYYGGYGRNIIINHGDGITIRYSHNSVHTLHSGVRTVVGQADVIALLGQTGNAIGQPISEAHVHFEVRLNGVPIDPAEYLNSPCPPPPPAPRPGGHR